MRCVSIRACKKEHNEPFQIGIVAVVVQLLEARRAAVGLREQTMVSYLPRVEETSQNVFLHSSVHHLE